MATRRAVSERLEQLRRELAASSSLSAADRERLEQLIADVRDHNERDEHEPSLADRLQEAMSNLEEDHPRLTLAIGKVADALAAIGI
jgi:endonuclease III